MKSPRNASDPRVSRRSRSGAAFARPLVLRARSSRSRAASTCLRFLLRNRERVVARRAQSAR